MLIQSKKQTLHLKDLSEFKIFVRKIISNLKDEYLPSELISHFNLNYERVYKNINSLRSEIKSFFYNNTILNREYWLTRGWTEDEAILKIKSEQLSRSLLSKSKMEFLKQKDNYKWKSLKNTNIEFYLERGFSLEESENLRKKRQSTFSKEVCVSKYGEKGLDIWKNRQIKWQNSLINSNLDNTKKDCRSSSFFKQKYGVDWIVKSIESNFFCNKELIKTAVLNSKDVDSFCNEIFQNKNVYSINELSSIFNSSVLLDFFDINSFDFKNKLLSKYGVIPQKFGNIRYFNNHICRSNGEYIIAKKLKESNIDYEYEKKYPNSKWISDFYIKKYELYIEYMGFLKADYMHKYNKQLCEQYTNKYILKKEFCQRNNINFIFDNDYKLIIKKILEYDYRGN